MKNILNVVRRFPTGVFVVGLLFGTGGDLLIVRAPGDELQNLPQPPKVFLDTTYSPPKGETIIVGAQPAVPPGKNHPKSPNKFQLALEKVQLGDTIVLEAGASYIGPFTLPNKKGGAGWIYIVSSEYAKLPPPGKRVHPEDVANMPTIIGGIRNDPAIITTNGSHHYRFCGVEFRAEKAYLSNLIRLGGYNDRTLDALPHDLTFDRCYIHGDPGAGCNRGIAMNGASIAVIDSYVSDFKMEGMDAQALWCSNGTGPFKIVNNYLEGSTENVMFGGASPKIANLIPSDIEIRHNYFFKRLDWMAGTTQNAGLNSHWCVKNLFEIKNAQRVLLEGNIFENCWGDAQDGFAMNLKPCDQDFTGPWTSCKDLTIRLNIFKNVGGGIKMKGIEGGKGASTQRAERILIENNVFNVVGLAMRAAGIMFRTQSSPFDVTIRHNTGLNSGTTLMDMDFEAEVVGGSVKAERFTFINNLVSHASNGVKGTGSNSGTVSLNKYFNDWTFAANVLIGGQAKFYPPHNYFPLKIQNVGFADYEKENYKLTSSYQNAGTDGKDIGADIDAVTKATAGVLTGR